MISMTLSLRDARSFQHEILDGGEFDRAEYETTLRQLEIINKLTRGYDPTLAAVHEVAKRAPGKTLRILDIGFGGGDTLRALARWARKAGIDLELTGVDLNPWAKDYAERVTPKDLGIRYVTGDVFDLRSPRPYDMIINALFMHHLGDRQVVDLLRWMSDHAALAWFINDLHRHPIAFYFIRHTTRLFGFNRLIRNDAPLSVARGFRSREWRNYLLEADLPLEQVSVRWHWSFRYGILFQKPAGPR